MGRNVSLVSPAGQVRTTSTSIVAQCNDRILCLTGGIVITLPPNAGLSDGDTVSIYDTTGVFASNPITVIRSGSIIQNKAEDLTVNVNNTSLTLTFFTAVGWLITAK